MMALYRFGYTPYGLCSARDDKQRPNEVQSCVFQSLEDISAMYSRRDTQPLGCRKPLAYGFGRSRLLRAQSDYTRYFGHLCIISLTAGSRLKSFHVESNQTAFVLVIFTGFGPWWNAVVVVVCTGHRRRFLNGLCGGFPSRCRHPARFPLSDRKSGLAADAQMFARQGRPPRGDH